MRVYAKRTKVPVERSQTEIKRIILRYGATSFQFGERLGLVRILFEKASRRVVFDLPLPTKGTSEEKLAQDHRRLWRSLAVVIKAKLEAVESGITTFEQEFYAHILLPNGKTVYQESAAAVEAAYTGGKMQPLLPEAPHGR